MPETVIFTMSPVPIRSDVFSSPDEVLTLTVPFVHPRLETNADTVVDTATPVMVPSDTV